MLLGLFGENSPIRSALYSANQMFPLASTAIASGSAFAVGTAYSATAFVVGLIRPILSTASSVNQRFPSAGSDTI